MLIRPVASSKRGWVINALTFPVLFMCLDVCGQLVFLLMMSFIVSREESSLHVWIQPLHLKTLITFFYKTTKGTSKFKTRHKRLLLIRQVKMLSYLLTSSSCSSSAAICSEDVSLQTSDLARKPFKVKFLSPGCPWRMVFWMCVRV